MNEYGLLFMSVIYYALMAILAVLLVWFSARKIASLYQVHAKRFEEGKEIREGSIVGSVILLIVLWVAYAGVGVLGWNVNQAWLAEPPKYQNPAEKKELQIIKEYIPATDKELIKAKKVLEEKRDDETHMKALDSFDEAMKKEAKKIKERSLPEEDKSPPSEESSKKD